VGGKHQERMQTLKLNRRHFLTTTAATALLPATVAHAQSGSVANIATVGEPGQLEPMLFTADLLTEIQQHFYETLYAFDTKFRVRPLLAADLPTVSEDAKTYTIKLRTGVPFHDGTIMTSDDVVTCLKRYFTVSPRGKPAGAYVTDVNNPDASTVVITLNAPYSPLLPLLAYFSAPAIVMPKRLAVSNDPVKEFVGTGPYKLLEHAPDRYVRVGKFDKYASPTGAPDGFAGERKVLIDELRFLPVPNPTTRADGLISGEFQFADVLTPDSYGRLNGKPGLSRGVVDPATWLILVLNAKQGIMTDVRLRQAVQASVSCDDVLGACFGDKQFWKLEGSIYPEGTDYYDARTPGYNKRDPDKAKALMRAANYDGTPVRFLTTTQYDYMFKTISVVAQNLQDVGFKTDVQVMDWPTMLAKRAVPANWEGFCTSGAIAPDPSLFSMLNTAYPGWWDSPRKRDALARFIAALNLPARVAAWKELQALFYEEVPTILIGNFYALYGISNKLNGFNPFGWPYFWNVKLNA
jgi:peptide/nickel transport system substrate-binding protein